MMGEEYSWWGGRIFMGGGEYSGCMWQRIFMLEVRRIFWAGYDTPILHCKISENGLISVILKEIQGGKVTN